MHDRHDRVASMLQETVAKFIESEANTNPLITVTRVTITPNYRQATVFITTIPEGKEADALIFLKRSGSELRSYIKKHSRMKYIPFIEFELDYGERHRQHIDDIARKIDPGTSQ